MSDFYDRNGNRLGLFEWARLNEDDEYKRIAHTVVRGREVSTIWLGLDHGFGMREHPIIFETMVFDSNGRELDIARYPFEKMARAGHASLVLKVEIEWRIELIKVLLATLNVVNPVFWLLQLT